MFKTKFDVTSKYIQVQAALLIENIKETEEYRKNVKRFIKNIKHVPYETIRAVSRIKYPMDHYVIGAMLNSKVKLINDGNISEKEIDAANMFAQYLESENIFNVHLNTGSLSYCHYSEGTINVGCNLAPLRKILRKSSLVEIILMTYLHEEGHRQDTRKIKEIIKLDNLIKKYGKEGFRSNRTKEKVYVVTIPDRVFKAICLESVKAEFRSWEYVREAAKCYRLNKEDLEIYRLWALYSYVNEHHKNMIKREIKIMNYIFRSEEKNR